MTSDPSDQFRLPRPRLRLAVAVVLSLGLTSTMLASIVLAQQDQTSALVEVQGRAREAGERVEASVRRAFTAAVAVTAQVATQPDLTATDFRRFVSDGGLLTAYPRISALSFARNVTPEDLDNFSAGIAARTGSAGIHPPADYDEDVVAVEFIEPQRGNEAALGFVLSSEPSRREAIERARDRGVPTASAPINLVQDGGSSSPTFLLVVPVYANGQTHPTGPERRRSFIGVASLVMRADVLLANVLPPKSTIDLLIQDAGPLEGDATSRTTPLYSSGTPQTDRSTSIDLIVGDRRWRLIASANDRFPGGLPSWFLVAISGVMLSLAMASVVNIQLTARDHAEALVAERTAELRIANEELIRANRAKTTFLSTVSHELRTPLAAIIGFVALLSQRAEGIDEDLRSDMLARVDRNAQNLQRLIEEILAYSRLEDDATPLQKADLDLSEVVARALDALSPITTDVVVRRQLAPGVLIHADRSAVDRILTNLMTNAVKYGGDGVSIDVVSQVRGGRAVLEVRDDGPGIPPKDLNRIFEQFERGSEHTTIAGTGIGLAIVHELAKRHDGETKAESVYGQSATFTVTFPLAPREATSATVT